MGFSDTAFAFAFADFRNAFLDASVDVPEAFRAQMGHPCQWAGVYGQDSPLDDAEFFGRWRGWVEAGPRNFFLWEGFAPEDYRDIPAVPPDPGCAWKTTPLAEEYQAP